MLADVIGTFIAVLLLLVLVLRVATVVLFVLTAIALIAQQVGRYL